MIRATLTIGGTNLTNYIKYPISITDKNLDESFNIYSINLYGMTESIPYKPNTICVLSLYQDDTLYATYDVVMTSDLVERIGVTDKYSHRLTMLEKTYLLSLDVLPDMTITRIVGSYEPTLRDVALKVLAQAEGNFSNSLTIETTTGNILNAIKSPELTFTRYTTIEALRLVFGMAKIVPYIQSGTVIKHVAVKTTSSTIANEVSKNEAYDPSTYRTRLYSTVDNFIGGGDTRGSILEPANGWMTPRSPNNVDIMPDAAIIKTSRPIYKVEGLELKMYATYIRRKEESQYVYRYYIVSVPLNLLNPIWFNNTTLNEYLYEKSVYDTLPNTDAGKGTAIYYQQGKNDIKGLTTIPETWSSFWAPQEQAMREIVYQVMQDNPQPKSEYAAAYLAAMEAYWIAAFGPFGTTSLYRSGLVPAGVVTDQDSLYTLNTLSAIDNLFLTKNANIAKLGFRLTYTPYINTKLFTYKERKENEPTYQSTMYYNQSANVVSDEMLGELHDKVIKRGSGTTLTKKFVHTNLSQLKDLGTRIDEYIITAKDITITATDVVTEYILNKYYAKLNQYVAVLEKFRQFSIPDENIVDRQYTVQEFVKFSNSKVTKTSQLGLSSYIGTQEINLFRISTYGTVNNLNLLYYPTNFAFNNAMIFEVQLPTQAVAGGQSIAHPNDTDGTRRMEQLVRYTNTNGRFDTATFTYGTDFDTTFTQQDSYDLPIADNVFDTTHATFTSKVINKDGRERLSISYIVHHIDETGKVYLNKSWTARNSLIGGAGIASGLKTQWTYGKPNGTSEKITDYGVAGSAVTASFITDGTSLKITPQANPGGGVAWSVIDEDNNILFWVDETTASTVYLNFSSTY